MKSLVSIIIPHYNRADLILETLESVISQSYTNWECIIVDDGSDDYNAQIVNKTVALDNRIKFLSRPKNKPKGANACRNFGLEVSKGEYVMWLDSDDLLHCDKLKLQLLNIQKEKVPFSVCKSNVFKESITEPNLELKSSKVRTDDSFNDFISKNIIIPIQGPIFKKSFLKDYSFSFDERLQAGQEWEFFARILLQFPDYGTIDEPLDYIRSHNNNISNNKSEHKYWHYYLARVYFEEKVKDNLSAKSRDILDRFYLFLFKRFCRKRKPLNAIRVFINKIYQIKKLSLTDMINLILGLIVNILFGKGDKFLSKVSLYK